MMMTMTNQTHTHTLGCVAKKEEVVALVIVVVDSGRWNVPAQQKKLCRTLCVQCCCRLCCLCLRWTDNRQRGFRFLARTECAQQQPMSVLSVLARRAHVPCATPALPPHSAVMSWSCCCCCLSYRDSTHTEERGKERKEEMRGEKKERWWWWWSFTICRVYF